MFALVHVGWLVIIHDGSLFVGVCIGCWRSRGTKALPTMLLVVLVLVGWLVVVCLLLVVGKMICSVVFGVGWLAGSLLFWCWLVGWLLFVCCCCLLFLCWLVGCLFLVVGLSLLGWLWFGSQKEVTTT